MVMAITLSALILGAAVLPVFNLLATNEETQASLTALDDHTTAVVVAERIAASVWRDANPPANRGTATEAEKKRFTVAGAMVRNSNVKLEQQWPAAPVAKLVDAVANFTPLYMLTDGATAANLNSGQLAKLAAIKLSWTDSATGRKLQFTGLAGDRQFWAGLVNLPHPVTNNAYDRHQYERLATYALGTMQ